MNPLSTIFKNPLVPEGDYWVRLADIDYLPQKPTDVSEGWVATLVIERVHSDQHGTTLRVAVHGTKDATGFRESFRDHFRCFDYPPHLAIGRWAKVRVLHREYNGTGFSQVLVPQQGRGAHIRTVHEAADYERQTGTFEHRARSLDLNKVRRDAEGLRGGGAVAG